MSSPYGPGGGPPGLPQGLPPQVVQGLVNQIAPPPQAGPPAAPPGPGGPPGPVPGSPDQMPRQPDSDEPKPPDQDQPGLDDDQAEVIKKLLADPKSRDQVDKLLRTARKDSRNGSNSQVDPDRRLQLAQGWNARISELAVQWNTARSKNPGASTASDEALLRVYYMTPIAPWAPQDAPFPIPLTDIDEYADVVRAHLVKNGWTDIDKIEDQTTRECFPMREALIKSGRGWRQQVEFVDQMLALTEDWLKKHGTLPEPDLEVLRATREGKGDPESQARDTDSSAYPPGGFRNPPSGPM